MSKEYVILKPRPGSARFRQAQVTSGMSILRETQDSDGRLSTEMGGAYNAERLPNTTGRRRPVFSSGKRKWLLILDNGNEADADWVNNLVKQCFFYHEKGPLKGQPIMEANLNNMDDPFFNHSQLTYRHEEGVHKFDLSNPLDQLLVAGERGRADDVTVSSVGAQKAHVRYMLIAGGSETGVDGKSVKKKVEAYKLLSNMGLAKKKMVAQVLLNRQFSSEPSEDALDVELNNFIEGGVKITSNGMTMIEYFLYIAKLDAIRLETLEKIQRGLRRSIIKRTGNVYQFSGVPIGNKVHDLLEYFFRTENSEEYERLNLKLGDETKGAKK